MYYMETQFLKVSNSIFVIFIISFFLFQSKIIYCVSVKWLTMLTRVRIVVDYANRQANAIAHDNSVSA